MSKQFNTKVYFKPGTQVRRIKLDANDSLESTKQRLIEYHQASPMFKLGEYSYQVMYKDEEEDWVIVDDETEWKEAVDSFLKRDGDLFRLQLMSVNKSLQKINQVRKDCQKVVMDRYNDNLRPLIEQLKLYLKDPEKHQEAKEWLIEISNKIGTQATEGFEDVQSWINREIPPKVEEAIKEIEKFADKVATGVESIGTSTGVLTAVTEPDHEIIEVNADPEDFILVDDLEQQEEQKVDEGPVTYPEVVEPEPEPIPEPEPVIQEEQKKPEPVSEPKVPQLEIPREYADAMRGLDEMGFTDKARNLQFLKQYKGDMVKAVSALLSLPF